MAALPYIQFYPSDYLADTAHLTTEEHGAYFLLILNYWQRGCALPDDDKRLALITRLSNECWTDVKRTLVDFFDVRDGEWRHYRIEADLEKVKSKSIKNSDAGKASARSRLAKKSTNVERALNERTNETPTIHIQIPDTNIDTTTTLSIDKVSRKFKKPTIEEITNHIVEKGYSVNPEKFFNYYESNGWRVGKNPMKSWTSALASWNSGDTNKTSTKAGVNEKFSDKDYGQSIINLPGFED